MVNRTALVIGGTGPSGPHLITGLLERGFDVTMFHSGRHEVEALPDIEHIHGNPFSRDGIAEALDGREADVVIATYGRVRYLAAAVAGRCEQFISVGGTPVYLGFVQPDVNTPPGLPARITEDAELVPPEGIEGAIYGVGAVRRTEDAVFSLHDQDAFSASVFRYPSIYGPRNPHSWEWSTIRRVLDGRGAIVVPDGGLPTHYRLSSWNAAHSMLLAVDHPDEASGQAFNCADDDQFSLRQWIELIVEHMGADLEILNTPGDVPGPGWALMVFRYECSPHVIVDTSKIRRLLGYADVVPAREGLGKTVDWIIANRDDAPTWSVLDPFDYEAEDAFIAALRESRAILAAAGEPYLQLPGMPLPQTASGSKKAK
jgi:nucleoside-diphosphate-sugar epimerase